VREEEAHAKAQSRKEEKSLDGITGSTEIRRAGVFISPVHPVILSKTLLPASLLCGFAPLREICLRRLQ
jgi:hypothetical protein